MVSNIGKLKKLFNLDNEESMRPFQICWGFCILKVTGYLKPLINYGKFKISRPKR
jgi:hypothetical protein